MARQPGLNNFAGTLEVLAGGPLDARSVVANKADLTTSGTFSYPYIGMIVSVEADGKVYVLTDLDYTNEDNWHLIEGSSGDTNGIVIGYYVNSIFYLKKIDYWEEPSVYEDPVTPDETKLYIDKDYYTLYFYNGVDYVLLDPLHEYTAMPETILVTEHQPRYYDGKVVQYLGTENYPTHNFKTGYFYECVTNPEDPTQLIWIQKDVQPHGIPQFTTMPNTFGQYGSKLGDIIQYIGETDSNYTNGYFYKCVEDGAFLTWEAINVQAGGSGSGSLSKAITAAIDVGGIEVGDNFAVGTSYDDMWDALLNPTLYPTFTNPTAALSYSADTYYEAGTSIPAKTAIASLNRGSISPAYGTSGYRSGEATNYALATSGADTEYSDSSASSGSFNVPALTRATKGNIVLTATVSYAAGEQPKDSKGNNYDSPLAAGSKTASKTMQFIQPYYYGKSSTSTVSDFTGLTKSVTAKGQKQFKFTTNNEYMVIAYDSSYGNLSSIIDPNGFETISGWTKSTITVGGFSYNVYVANSATTDTNAQFTFKY